MRQDTGQRSRKTEAVRQHVFGAGFAEVGTEIFISVENLPEDRLRRRRVDITLLHGRACGEPFAGRDVLLHLGIIGGIVLLHQTITVCAAEIEDVMRIFLEEIEIVV